MKKSKQCNSKHTLIKKENGYSGFQVLWSEGKHDGQVTWYTYRCDKGHEVISSEPNKFCTSDNE
tara:strand:- start:1354 stop:1545 length:192 start_codon:yes stop_codon:yes gene_type:complete